MTEAAPRAGHMFIADLGLSYRADGDAVVGEVVADPFVCVPGTARVRPSVLATVADVVTGVLASRSTGARVALTSDLSVYGLSMRDTGRLGVVGRIVKAGRTLVIGEAWFTADGHEQPVGVSEVCFIASPRPQDVLPLPSLDRVAGAGGLDRPFDEQLGARVVAPGVVEMDRDPYVLQPAGTIQGGAVVLLVELAASSFTGRSVAALQIRFLSAVRIGPARTSTRLLTSDTVRVEIHDAGNDGRLTAIAAVRVLDEER